MVGLMVISCFGLGKRRRVQLLDTDLKHCLNDGKSQLKDWKCEESEGPGPVLKHL